MDLRETFNFKLRKLQNLLGPTATQLAMRILGSYGTRFLRELLGLNARHRIQKRCNKERIGVGTGAWTICPDLLTKESIIYSLGVGTDISFDLELIERFMLDVYAFDPTPRSLAWVKSRTVPDRFHLAKWGIHNFDGFARFIHLGGDQYTISMLDNSTDAESFKVYRLKTTMEKLNHWHIDLLKMNIEGGEYCVIEDMLLSHINVTQIVLEFHHRLRGYRLSQTEAAVKALNRRGYKIFNIQDGKEYSFIKQ